MTGADSPAVRASARSTRLPALDWMRGLVMMLMVVDHASDVFNRDRVQADSAAWGGVGSDLTPLDVPWHFLTRWITHLCAPTFVLLAGAALALSVERRLARGASPRSIDLHLVRRGLVLVALEVWMSIGFQILAVQVLWAIGASILCMVVLRRLPSALLLGAGVAWMVFGEFATEALSAAWVEPGRPLPVPYALLFENAYYPLSQPVDLGLLELSAFVLVVYPLLPWLAIFMVGWVFGRWLLARRSAPQLGPAAAKLLAAWGGIAAAAFLAQRLADGPEGAYGNWNLRLTDGSALRWLQVSKYPPSLAFYALELGIAAFLLAGFFLLQRRSGARVERWNPLLVFGQCALFFYVLHLHVMGLFRFAVWGTDLLAPAPFGLAGAWVGAACTLVALYPLCLWFRAQREARPDGWTRWF